MELVSVIIPVYNREKTIKKAIESVLNQTYDNIEVIAVDDCSSDRSVEVIQNINDKRVRVITCQNNAGACRARNIGIEKENSLHFRTVMICGTAINWKRISDI